MSGFVHVLDIFIGLKKDLCISWFKKCNNY